MNLDHNVQRQYLEIVKERDRFKHDETMKQMELDKEIDVTFRTGSMPKMASITEPDIQQICGSGSGNDKHSVKIEEIDEEGEAKASTSEHVEDAWEEKQENKGEVKPVGNEEANDWSWSDDRHIYYIVKCGYKIY